MTGFLLGVLGFFCVAALVVGGTVYAVFRKELSAPPVSTLANKQE